MLSISKGRIALTPDGSRHLDVTLRLDEHDVALLVGANGSGKTTLLDVIAGVRRLQAGTMSRTRPAEPLAYAVQDSAAGLLPWRTVSGNILLPARLHNGLTEEIAGRASQLLHAFRLGNRGNDYPYKLSGGEKQLVNLIRTLCTPCAFAVIDEVLSSLHHDLRAAAKRELAPWLTSRTAVIVTHDPEDLDLPYTRFFSINGGMVDEVDRATAERVLSNAT